MTPITPFLPPPVVSSSERCWLVLQVWQVPPQAEVMAWSEKTGVEMFRYGDHILGIQGHPEYSKDILRHLLDRLLQRNLIQVRR